MKLLMALAGFCFLVPQSSGCPGHAHGGGPLLEISPGKTRKLQLHCQAKRIAVSSPAIAQVGKDGAGYEVRALSAGSTEVMVTDEHDQVCGQFTVLVKNEAR